MSQSPSSPGEDLGGVPVLPHHGGSSGLLLSPPTPALGREWGLSRSLSSPGRIWGLSWSPCSPGPHCPTSRAPCSIPEGCVAGRGTGGFHRCLQVIAALAFRNSVASSLVGLHPLPSFAGSRGVHPPTRSVLLGEVVLRDGEVIAFIRLEINNPTGTRHAALAPCALPALFSLYCIRQANKSYYLCCKACLGLTAILGGCGGLGGHRLL